MPMRRVPIVEVGDHQTDVFTVPLEGIDEFIRDNRDDYNFAYGELSAELGAMPINLTAGSSKTIAPVSSTSDGMFVRSPTAKSASTVSLVMAKPIVVPPPKPAPPPPPPPPPPPAPAPKPAGPLASVTQAINKIVSTAVTTPVAQAGAQVADAANKINAALAASVGQTNKAPTISPTTFTSTPSSALTMSAAAKYTLPAIIKPTVAAALTAPVAPVIKQAAAVIAADKALSTPAPATPVTDPNAFFKSPDRTTSINIKDVVAAKPLSATKKVLDAQPIQPAPVVTSRIDPGPYLTMKPSVEPLTAAKLAEQRPAAIVQKVAALAPDVSAIPAIKALAQAAKNIQPPAGDKIATLLDRLSEVGGPEKCACIVARKKQGLAALGVQSPTLRSKVPQKTFVASSRVDFQGQVLDALRDIERNTSNDQLRAQLAKLRGFVG